MRCLALAESWRARHGEVQFVGRCDVAFERRLAAAKMSFTALRAAYPDPVDAATMRELASRIQPAPIVIVDGYHLDRRYQESLRDVAGLTVLIDDSEQSPDCAADVIVNPNFHGRRIPYDSPPQVAVLAGPTYALLRSEFRTEATVRRPAGALRRVVALVGATDPSNASRIVLDAFAQLGDADIELDLIVGPGNTRVAELRDRATSIRGAGVSVDPPSVAALLREADLAIVAAGTATWECAALGVPCILVSVAANQRPVARELASAGAAVDAGAVESLTADALAESLRRLSADAAARAALASRARLLVDGCGAERVATVLEALVTRGPIAWTVRPVGAGDALQIWRIANDPSVREHSFTRRPIQVAEHLDWFGRQLNAAHTRWWAADLGGVVAAHVRYTAERPGEAEVHFSVAAPFRGRGIAVELLERTIAGARGELDVRVIRGVAFARNTASVRVFERAGYSAGTYIDRGGERCVVFERRIA